MIDNKEKEDIFWMKANAFRKKVFEQKDETADLMQLSGMLDDVVNFLPTYSLEVRFDVLHRFLNLMLDDNLFEHPRFFHAIFRKLLNLYAYYLENDSYAVCAVLIAGFLSHQVIFPATAEEWEPLLHYLYRELPSFPLLDDDNCRDLYDVFMRSKKFAQNNPQLIFYSYPFLRQRLEESVRQAAEMYGRIQIVLQEDSSAIGALLLLSLFSDEFLEHHHLMCRVPVGAIIRGKGWLEVPAVRRWLDKNVAYHHSVKKLFHHITEKELCRRENIFCLVAGCHQRFPDLSNQAADGFFLLMDCFEPELPDFSLHEMEWAPWDKPSDGNGFFHQKQTDRFLTLRCLLTRKISGSQESDSLINFYKSIRGIKSETAVWEKWRNASLKEPVSAVQFLLLADIYCRAGKFDASFELIEKYYEAKIAAAYRICTSILRHSNSSELREKVATFVRSNELFQKAFCAELHDTLEDGDETLDKSRWL